MGVGGGRPAQSCVVAADPSWSRGSKIREGVGGGNRGAANRSVHV